jgi:hypothetical protein
MCIVAVEKGNAFSGGRKWQEVLAGTGFEHVCNTFFFSYDLCNVFWSYHVGLSFLIVSFRLRDVTFVTGVCLHLVLWVNFLLRMFLMRFGWIGETWHCGLD